MATIDSVDRPALDRSIAGEVVGADQPAAELHLLNDLIGHLSSVESLLTAFHDVNERFFQVGLNEPVAFLPGTVISRRKDATKLRQIGALHGTQGLVEDLGT